jgi:hypothetical protein
MRQEEINQIIESTFTGLTFLCRDLDLESERSALYKVGQVLLERGFIDTTNKIKGLDKNCRYLIASSKGKDIAVFNPKLQAMGHIVIPAGSYFKVLDIIIDEGKTQILLLQIPAEGISIFSQSSVKFEDQIIKQGRSVFRQTKEMPPFPLLMDQEWIDRTTAPIGMSEEGAFFLK